MTVTPFNFDALSGDITMQYAKIKESYEQAIQRAIAATTECAAYNALFRKVEQLEERMARQESV